MRVIVFTSDKYLHLLPIFIHQFKRYWQPPRPNVYVYGFTPPTFDLPVGFSFASIGPFAEYPIGRWSNAIIKVLNGINEDIVLPLLEDYWLIEPVKIDVVHRMLAYIKAHPTVAKIDLCADRLYAAGVTDYGSYEGVEMVLSDPSSPYHMSLMPGLWRRRHLLDMLIPNESPWDVEIAGTGRLARRRDLQVIGTKHWPLKIALGARSGDPAMTGLAELPLEDRQRLVEFGYIQTA